MPPMDFPLDIYRGDTGKWAFKLWIDAEKTQPADLTGVTAAAELRQDSKKTVLKCTKAANQIDVEIAPADSQQLTVAGATAAASNAWDLQLTYSDGTVQTIVAGGVTVRADVTGSA